MADVRWPRGEQLHASKNSGVNDKEREREKPSEQKRTKNELRTIKQSLPLENGDKSNVFVLYACVSLCPLPVQWLLNLPAHFSQD